MSASLVSIVGPPASGKTTLADLLGRRLGAKVIYEDFAGNPFLADSYQGQPDTLLPAQVYYLMSRAKQLATCDWPADGIVVSDYGYLQDRVYARAKLTGADLETYEQLAAKVDGLVVTAGVIIHLDAPVDVLRRRIARRGRGFERTFGDAFLQHLRDAYNERASQADSKTWLRVDSGEDFRQGEVLERIETHVLAMLAGETGKR
ncbi:MAG: deoxynucleoside kinase [Planctomycetota bacterium]